MKDKLKQLQQLQLGNYVLVQDGRLLENNYTPKVGKVSCISTESIKVNNKAVKYYNFEFIPINEEWLVKLGFVYNSVNNDWEFTRNEVAFILYFHESVMFSAQNILITLKYVHELQNFFSTCFKIKL